MWEEARMADAFTPEQKHRMEDIGNEFHLEEAGEEGWNLFQIHSSVLRYEYRERQPGEPSHETFTFQNREGEQPLRFVLTAVGASVDGVRLELDGVRTVELGVRLRDGEALAYQGGDRATVYSSQWRVMGSVPVDATDLLVGSGEHRLLLDAALEAEEGGHLKVELRIWGEAELVPRH
ncbi:MAG: hypothetical protein KAJ42_08080, partial [Gemmatimonadetes bacterium]|nr:hypothetical protein [Gemmatimonadota bacterium]